MPHPLPFLSRVVCILLGLIGATALRAAEAAPAVQMTVLRLPNGLRFGLIGEHRGQPAPTLFVLQGDLDVARTESIYTEVARLLARHGFMSVMLDAPAHGEDHRPDEPTELAAWRARLERGEDFIGGFTANARAVLDYLVKEGYTDPSRVAACGTSRGGFLAFHLAAVEPRIRCVGGIAPVTDLTALREFNATTRRPQAEALALVTLVPKLAGRAAWACIGNNDTRVGTDQAIAFMRALVRVGAKGKKEGEPVPVELIVDSSPGHRSSVHDHELLAAWMLEHVGNAAADGKR